MRGAAMRGAPVRGQMGGQRHCVKLAEIRQFFIFFWGEGNRWQGVT